MKFSKITSVLALFIVMVITIPVVAQGHNSGPNKIQTIKGEQLSNEKVFKTNITSYGLLSEALFKDDLITAKKVALLIAKGEESKVVKFAASKLAKSEDLKSARSNFNEISKVLVAGAKGSKDYKIAYCPMANRGTGGYWLQKVIDKTVNNPYFGSSMPHCGVFK